MREKTRQTTRRVNLRFGIYKLRFREYGNTEVLNIYNDHKFKISYLR